MPELHTHKVYILILNYKRWEDTVECLESIFRLKYKNFTVIVIDNDSKNDSIEHLMRWAKTPSSFSPPGFQTSIKSLRKPIEYTYLPKRDAEALNSIPKEYASLIFIQNNENKGFANGNNLALRLILQEDAYVWLLNPDMVVEESTLTELINCAGGLSSNIVLGSIIKSYNPPHKVLFNGGGKINFYSGTVDLGKENSHLDYISGGSLFTSMRSFNDIGMLPEQYFLYWEETDWCYQASQKEYQMAICSSAICYDKVSTTIGKGFLADYYYTRNGFLFIAKYKKAAVPIALVFSLIRLMKRILTGKWQRARGVFKGMTAFLFNKSNEN